MKEKLLLVRGLIAPILLVAMVLGLLFAGIATPVEAAGLGSLGAMGVAALHKRLTLKALIAASAETVKATSMVLWIIFGASIFVGLYILQGGQAFITDAILGTGWNSYGILFLMMFLLVILGMFLDWVGILLLAVPIFVPIVQSLTFDGLFGLPGPSPDAVVLWFGVLYLINMQMSFLSPPFGYALFYIRGVAPPEITMATIFRSSLVFLAIQVLALIVVVIFPVIATGLPDLVYGR
jgi:TRAP-type mannitol/chloroaromatic compound transport system permease large subunit